MIHYHAIYIWMEIPHSECQLPQQPTFNLYILPESIQYPLLHGADKHLKT